MGSLGSSLTEGTAISWSTLLKNWLIANYPVYDLSSINQARSGNWPWSNLVRLNAELFTTIPDLVLCDYRAVASGRETKSLEAITRRVFTVNPYARMISPIFPSTTDGINVDAQDAVQLASNAMALYYGVVLIDYRQAVIDLVAGGHLLSEYMADNIHPTAVGYALCASMVEAYILANPGWAFGSEDHTVLPARLYDDGSYENLPVRKVGTDNEGTTGTWTTTGTRIESNEVNATVTFTAFCQSFGLYSAGVANTVGDVQIDGGAWQLNKTISHNGYDPELIRQAHTITIRVRAGVPIRIDEFWAI